LIFSLCHLGGVKIRNQAYIQAFGRHIKALRLERNLSQEALSTAASIEKKSLVRIENGEINTTISTALALATALGLQHFEIYKFDYPSITLRKE
jgi:DNA-binding XRE family transcriptional regulator